MEKKGEELSFENWKKIFISAKKLKCSQITITGGEPFLRKDLPEIISFINSLKIKVHLCTNGTLINQDIIRKIKKSPPESISFSIDSHIPEIHDSIRGIKGSFNKTINSIRLVKSNLPSKITINRIITAKNFDGLCEMVKLSKELGVNRIHPFPLHTHLQHKDKDNFKGLLIKNPANIIQIRNEINLFNKCLKKYKLDSLSKEYLNGIPNFFKGVIKNKGCFAGYVSTAIDSKGFMFPCEDFSGNFNVKSNNLEKIWKSDEFHKQRLKASSCNKLCWDSTHRELNLLLSGSDPIKALKNLFYYL